MSNRAFLASALLLLAAGAPAVLADGAELRGRVLLEGPVPEPKRILFHAKNKEGVVEGCGAEGGVSPRLLVSPEGGVRGVVAWIETPAAEPKKRTVLLDQKGCQFEPHVAVVTVGEEILIRNSDPVLHNVRIFSDGKPALWMHRWQRIGGADISWRFDQPGRYVVRCGVHPWMYAWVVVLPPDASGAVTDVEGRFTLSGVPAGKRRLRVWHETLGESERWAETGRGEEGREDLVIQWKRDSSGS